MNRDEEARFWAKVQKGADACWLWTGSRNPDGYGGFWSGGRLVRAHRASYELLVGPIPAGLQLDHLCRVPPCVNPEHLEPVTNRENVLRGVSFSAVNAAKTECVNGHPFDERNTYARSDGGRGCRACRHARKRAFMARKRAAARLARAA